MRGISSYTSYWHSAPCGNREPAGAEQKSGVLGSAVSQGDHTKAFQENTVSRTTQSQEFRQQLRDLKRSTKKEQDSTQSASEALWESAVTDGNEEEEKEKPVQYNYKEVSAKIQRAKNPVSAGRAVLSAKRKVLELKRKISTGDGDPEELQFALTHAKRMELVAKKKKRHLELEEIVTNTQRRDESAEKMEEAAEGLRNAMLTAGEEKLGKREDEIFEAREEQITEAADEMRKEAAPNADEMLQDLNKLLSEMGEEELKELEEAMELLENMEIIDPHMSEEDLKELKQKHRAAERKALVKADMDYLKNMVKHQIQKAAALPGSAVAGGSAFRAAGSPLEAAQFAAPAGMSMEGGTVDVQV